MSEILIYTNDKNNIEIEVNYEEKTLWLDAHQMATLFDRDRTVIVRHINNIYKAKELSKKSSCAKNAQVKI